VAKEPAQHLSFGQQSLVFHLGMLSMESVKAQSGNPGIFIFLLKSFSL
jgi:hypothetical protein